MAIDQASKLRDIATRLKKNRKQSRKSNRTRRIAITSGKGGVGKSSFSLNLAIALTKLKKKVLLIDADINLGNLDILLGITPEYLLRDVIDGRISLKQLLIQESSGLTVMPASSGDLDVLRKSEEAKQKIERDLELLELEYDFILIDTGAGIGDEVIDFSLNSDEVIVVTTAEPTAFTDAYALIKVLTSKSKVPPNLSLLVNMVSVQTEAEQVYEKIEMVTNHFLQTEIKFLGFIIRDQTVSKAIIQQQPFLRYDEKCIASRNLWSIAVKLATATKFSGNNKRLETDEEESASFFKKMIK